MPINKFEVITASGLRREVVLATEYHALLAELELLLQIKLDYEDFPENYPAVQRHDKMQLSRKQHDQF